jgi:hypothetical protein
MADSTLDPLLEVVLDLCAGQIALRRIVAQSIPNPALIDEAILEERARLDTHLQARTSPNETLAEALRRILRTQY